MYNKTARVLLYLLTVWLAQPSTLLACTTAVFGPAATADGAPLLWKNRDTNVLSIKVVFVPEKPFSYLGLVNTEETSGLINTNFSRSGSQGKGLGYLWVETELEFNTIR